MVIIFIHVIVVHLSVRPHFSKSSYMSSENNDLFLWDCGNGRGDHWWHLPCYLSFGIVFLAMFFCFSSSSSLDIFDPLGRPTVTDGSDHCFCSCSPYVRPHFSKSSKTKQSENNVRYWRDCGSGRVDHWWHLPKNCSLVIPWEHFYLASGTITFLRCDSCVRKKELTIPISSISQLSYWPTFLTITWVDTHAGLWQKGIFGNY